MGRDSTANVYGIAIIGAGIGGSTLGAILARQGLKVILFEAGSHPKSAVGESMILATSETPRVMAEFYDAPELADFGSEHYVAQIGTSHGIKRHFSYLHHSEGYPQEIARSLQAVIPRQPRGHERHLRRQDSDYLLTAVAVSYGATVLQTTPGHDITITPAGVEVITAHGARFAAAYVVDAGGFRAILAERCALRDTDLRRHSRTIFTHMVDVPCYNSAGASQPSYDLPFRLAAATLHHIFKGDWLRVVPFDNHPRSTNPLCRVGLQVDPRRYPIRHDLAPAGEFYGFIARFPSIPAQFQRASSAMTCPMLSLSGGDGTTGGWRDSRPARSRSTMVARSPATPSSWRRATARRFHSSPTRWIVIAPVVPCSTASGARSATRTATASVPGIPPQRGGFGRSGGSPAPRHARSRAGRVDGHEHGAAGRQGG